MDTNSRGDDHASTRSSDDSTDLLVYVDRSTVREGKLDELKSGMENLVAFVAEHEPEILAYNVYFNVDGDRMTVMHVHATPESLAFHMAVAGPEFPKVAEFITLERIDVYGRPGEEILDRLRAKASSLGTGRVSVHDRHDGFDRILEKSA